MDLVPGIDVSRWQRRIDWDRVAEGGHQFAAIRATIGNYYTDPRFYVNWDGAKEAGLFVSAYHVVAPERPADSQMDRFFEVLDGRQSDMPLVLDVELSRDVSSEDITQCVASCTEMVEDETARKPMIYTARWFWDRHVEERPEWGDYDLWVAHYGVQEPTLPRGWKTWRLWQYSDHGQVTGIGAATDLNRFNGDEDGLLAYVNAQATDEGPPLEGLKARVAVERLRVRSGPGMNYEPVGELREGELVNVVSLSGEDIWIQVEPGRWAPYRALGKRYMELE